MISTERMPPHKKPEETRVIVGLSGGVDSSVAALRLLEAGYQVEGLFMKNWEGDDNDEYCAAKADMLDALSVADRLGIEFHFVNFAQDYWDRVFAHFLDEYRAGRTPNPDILCNREIKFRAFLDHARTLGADYIATGHYARVQHALPDGSGQTRLLKGLDANKDQSYFLHALSREQLASALFPIGEMEKPEVRRIAGQAGFKTATKKDSTGICFIGERRFSEFLKTYLPAQPGDIVTVDGQVVGQHQGLMYHTIGQRQGLGIGGLRDQGDQPWYVAAKNLHDNTLIVAQGKDHPALFAPALRAGQIHWINDPMTHVGPYPLRLTAKIRYRQPDQSCTVNALSEDLLHVTFDQPQRAITPGQSIVFYQGDVCLGGAVIEEAVT
ncbi:MAG: tRNA 2-thiouridine(34) synthase MnmA [Halothiobacillus sp.]|nr:tRNA 2-thiouridine(34) synthase MnmA [Halothiobacillus sp.]